MATPTVYVICDKNCKFEGMTKEQILTAITQAVNNGSIGNIDTGFITTVKTITGTPLKFFVGEQSEYEALTESDRKNLFAIITNDATKTGLLKALEELQTEFSEFKDRLGITDEIEYSTIPESGTTIQLESGKTYIISSKSVQNSKAEANTYILHIPTKMYMVQYIQSTRDLDDGYYFWNPDTNILKFATTANKTRYSVYIRKI